MTDFSVQNLFFLFYITFDHFTTNQFLFQWIILISDSFVTRSNDLLVFSLHIKEIIFVEKPRFKNFNNIFSSIFFLFSSFFFLFKCLFVYSSSLQKRRKFVIASFFPLRMKKEVWRQKNMQVTKITYTKIFSRVILLIFYEMFEITLTLDDDFNKVNFECKWQIWNPLVSYISCIIRVFLTNK